MIPRKKAMIILTTKMRITKLLFRTIFATLVDMHSLGKKIFLLLNIVGILLIPSSSVIFAADADMSQEMVEHQMTDEGCKDESGCDRGMMQSCLEHCLQQADEVESQSLVIPDTIDLIDRGEYKIAQSHISPIFKQPSRAFVSDRSRHLSVQKRE
jgi:hypothetical protein